MILKFKHLIKGIVITTLLMINSVGAQCATVKVTQDSLAQYVKTQLAKAKKVSRVNTMEALTITEKLFQIQSIQKNDSIQNFIKYRHSLYLLLSDRNTESQEMIKETLPYYEHHDFKKWVILKIRLGSISIRLGKYDEASKILNEAIQFCDSLKLKLNKGMAKVYLADIELVKSNFGKAFQCADQAREIFNKIERVDWEASALTDLAYICIRAKDYNSAKEYFEKIKILLPRVKNQTFLIRPILFEGIYNYELGNFASAKKQLEEGITQINDVGTFPDIPIVFQYLAKIAIHNQDYSAAKNYIASSTKYAEEANNKNLTYNSNFLNIELQTKLNPNHNYLEEAMAVYKWAKDNENIELRRESSYLIAKRYEKILDYQKAIYYRNIYEDALVQSINNDKYNQIALRNEKSKYQQEAEQTKLREENLQLQLDADKSIKYILLSGISLLTFLLSYICYIFIQNRKTNNLLNQNNQELKKAEIELERKNKELQSYIKSNIQLEQFAHVASHDLRAPVVTINGFTKLLKNKAKSKFDAEELKYLGYIESNGLQMQELVTDLLDYSKLNSQALNIENLEAEKIIYDLSVLMKTDREKKNITMSVENEIPAIKADEIKLKRVFQNLLSNAIKFSDPSKEESFIKIKTKENNTHYIISIEDNGIGMEKNQVDIFKPYVQLNKKSDFQGTGLGLSLCKTIIEQHGGTIDYQSQVNHGTTFTFSISKNLS